MISSYIFDNWIIWGPLQCFFSVACHDNGTVKVWKSFKSRIKTRDKCDSWIIRCNQNTSHWILDLMVSISLIVYIQDIDILQGILNFFLITKVKICFSVFIKPNNAGVVYILELKLILKWNLHQNNFSNSYRLIIILIFSNSVTNNNESKEWKK